MLISSRKARVLKILEEYPDLQVLEVLCQGERGKALNYRLMTGRAQVHDQVQLNTTALELGLGTGGYHFVMAILDKELASKGEGHIMKLRYTPEQVKVLAVEEQASPYHQQIKDFTSLDNKPVLIGFLHSMVLPAVAGIKAINSSLKISYVMTDGGALPMAFSKNVRKLQELNWLQGTVTVGHAFGGDLEAINIYSGLAAAHSVLKADIIIVAMGPGIVGTGTSLGTTALEVGQIINAVSTLGGHPIVIPRINFKDSRQRHWGLSHHTITVLDKIALTAATVILPQLSDGEKEQFLEEQLQTYQLKGKHRVELEDGQLGLQYLLKRELAIETMGKSYGEEMEFFLAACAAGTYSARLV